MDEKQSIKDTLSVIRKALEEDQDPIDNLNIKDDVLILDKIVKDDGTIDIINNNHLSKIDTIEVLNNKLDKIFDAHLSMWFDKNIPNYLEKYFKKKDI